MDSEEGIEFFDFTLPDEATNYVITVSFTEQGQIDTIAMES